MLFDDAYILIRGNVAIIGRNLATVVTFKICAPFIKCIIKIDGITIEDPKVLTDSLSDVPSKLGSCFYVFQTMFLTFNFLHPTENLIQCPFQQAGILFFGLWCFCIISKRSYVLNNFRNYFHAKAFQKPLTIVFNNFWLCVLRFLPYFLIIRFFLICVCYVFVSASWFVSLCLFYKYLCLYTSWNTYQTVKFILYL